jgi:signal peptidase I
VKDKTASKSGPDSDAKTPDGGWRETIESILMAIVLALLFRGFVAEAFVIPTGSMAPTLMGRHKDLRCPKCNGEHWYQVSASAEVSKEGAYTGHQVVSGTCPSCRYTTAIDPSKHSNEGSFSGDRIIVSKFIYDFQQPERWDVIVFKYPGDATQNYIKRLVGLPGETVTIIGGNIYVMPTGGTSDQDRIARKPPKKLDTLLQLVDDSSYRPQELIDVGWPAQWEAQGAVASGSASGSWESPDGGRSFVCKSPSSDVAWLRYRHRTPSYEDWQMIVNEKRVPDGVQERGGQLITDFYAYDAGRTDRGGGAVPEPPLQPLPSELGMHWVDDLAVECNAEVTSSEGAIWLSLIRAGVHHRCRINLADGMATLSRVGPDGQPQPFMSDDGKEVMEVSAQTSVKGPGNYRLRLSNCDHEVLLWVDGSVVAFDGPTSYFSHDLVRPVWSAEDPGDLAPAGIGSENAAVSLTNLRIYRDKYYIAIDYRTDSNGTDYVDMPSPVSVLRTYSDPESWANTPLFDPDNRRDVVFPLEEDQFFPLGDNSPQSQDGRLWSSVAHFPNTSPPPPFVHRELLIGKALLIYWPHTWNRPIPFWPNFRRMGLIH